MENETLAMLHYVSSFLELSTKIQPTIDLSPNINSISFKDINSTGKFLYLSSITVFDNILISMSNFNGVFRTDFCWNSLV